jgi:biopolymer transport protein ExbB
MLGLLGTVWGMILAFGQFAMKANPTPSELAPAISLALVTTLQGLVVAIPALGAFSWFRNRIDEFVAETSLLAEHTIHPLKRSLAERRQAGRMDQPPRQAGTVAPPRAAVPPVAAEREPSR